LNEAHQRGEDDEDDMEPIDDIPVTIVSKKPPKNIETIIEL